MKADLLEIVILKPGVGTQSSVSANTGLSFEQQKELLLLKKKHELHVQVELEKK